MAINPTKVVDLKDVLKLDLATFVLDMAGIVDPAGVADVASAANSLWRGDWLTAGISFLGVFAGIGDLAKIGKLRKYAASVEKAIELARTDAVFAVDVRNNLKGLKGVLDRLPMDHVPADIRALVQRMRYQIDNYIAEVPPLKPAQSTKLSTEAVEISRSLEEARNGAVAWLEKQGAVFGPHVRPIPGKLHKKHTGKEIGVGVASTQGSRWEIRIDFDPIKGPHYNVKFQPYGKQEMKRAFTFPPPAGVDPEHWTRGLMERLGDTSKRPLRR